MNITTIIKLYSLFAFSLLVLQVSAQRPGDGSLRSAQGNFSQYLSKTTLKNLDAVAEKKAGMITVFNNVENTVGDRFLFNNWVKGDSVLDMQGSYINAVSFAFNFDKLTGNLLVTQDKINIMSAVPNGISSFVLEEGGRQFRFEHERLIDATKFFETLVKEGSRYGLYKLHSSKFIPANNRNDGVIKTGNSYDEYKDATQYYIVDRTDQTSSLVHLKPKSIRAVFKDTGKVDTYFHLHKAESLTEDFLKGLIFYLNQ